MSKRAEIEMRYNALWARRIEMVRLRAIEGWTLKQIGDRFGLSTGNVHTHIRKAQLADRAELICRGQDWQRPTTVYVVPYAQLKQGVR